MARPVARRYYSTGGRYVKGALDLTLRSAISEPLPGFDLSGLTKVLGMEGVAPRDMAAEMVRKRSRSPAEYRSRIGDYVKMAGAMAFERQKARFGVDASIWSLEARRQVYSVDLSTRDAHVVLVVSAEPVKNFSATDVLKDPNLARISAGTFPGGFMSISTGEYADMIAGARAIDGTPENSLERSLPDIIKRNQAAYETGAMVEGRHVLGSNSVIETVGHDIYAHQASPVQTMLNQTSMVHSQHGTVPWCWGQADGFDGVVCSSIHLGSNPVLGGDIVNAGIAPALFKNIFRRGLLFYDNKAVLEAKLGKEAVAQIMLNPLVYGEFLDLMAHEDFRMVTDGAVLGMLDASGGRLLNALHFFTDTKVSEIHLEDIESAKTCDEFNELGEKGEARYENNGLLGETGFSPPAATDLVPDRAMLESGVIRDTSSVSTSWSDLPVPAEVHAQLTKYGAELDALSAKLDWSKIEAEVAKAIHDRALGDLKDIPTRLVIGSSSDVLASALNTDSLKSDVSKAMIDTMNQQLIQEPSFQSLLQSLDPDVDKALAEAGNLFALDWVAPKFQSVSMEPYLTSRLVAETASHKLVLMENSAGEIQAATTAIRGDMSTTASEKSAVDAELATVKSKLSKSPTESEAKALEEQQAELQRQSEDLERQDEALKEQEKAASDMTEAEERRKSSEAETSAESHGEAVFKAEK